MIFTAHLSPSLRTSHDRALARLVVALPLAVSLQHFKACGIDAVLPPNLGSSVAPEHDDITRFILFYPSSKEVIELESITSNVLQNSRETAC